MNDIEAIVTIIDVRRGAAERRRNDKYKANDPEWKLDAREVQTLWELSNHIAEVWGTPFIIKEGKCAFCAQRYIYNTAPVNLVCTKE